MSAAEIADNKWETEASKPQLFTPGSIAQLIMMVGFSLFFAYILVFSVIGLFSEKQESDLGSKFSKMNAAEAPAEEAKPAE
jgi:hypothetical protein